MAGSFGVLAPAWGAVLMGLSLFALAGAARADEVDKEITRHVKPGEEIIIRGFAEFDSTCHMRRVQPITFVDPPSQGVVSARPGEVTVSKNWVGNTNCDGTRLDGVKVYYRANADFKGTDHFSFDVSYSKFRTVHARVDVIAE